MEIVAEPLTRDAFTRFGEVIEGLSQPGRVFYNRELANARGNAKCDLSLAMLNPTPMPLHAKVMERHEFSSQSIVPLRVARYLVIVAPRAADGGPDPKLARAFLANSRQGVTIRMNTWHHGLTVLDEPGEFGVLMWCDGTRGDEEFRPLAHPFTVTIPD